jgi:HlyD family secretion protein
LPGVIGFSETVASLNQGEGIVKFKSLSNRTAIYGAIILVLLFALISYIKPAKIPAYSVIEQDYVPSLLLSGEVIAEGSTLLSSLSSGKVIDCPVAEGEKVKKGQLLVQIDDAQARVDRDRAAVAVQIAGSQLQKAGTVTREEARANCVQADCALEKAEREYERNKALADVGAVSQVDLEQAERNKIVAQEQARSARAVLESLEQNGSSIAILQAELQQRQLDLTEKEILLEQFKILAPEDGELLDLYVRPGELLTSGSKVALLAAGGGLRVMIQPDQRYAEMASVGNKAQVWITNAANAKWDARVVTTEPCGNAEQGSFTAELEFINNVPPLYPGQLVSVQLFGPMQPAAIILPDSYLTVNQEQNGVWLAINNRAHFTPVQIGLRTGEGVVITEGLKQGDLVLQPTGLKENMRVSPQQESKR